MPYRITTFNEYQQEYQKSIQDPEGFWAEKAESLTWKKKWDKVLEWDFVKGETKWFLNAQLNITENCLDRHLYSKANKAAIIWEPNDPKEKGITLTYAQLHQKVCQFANVLKNNGVKKGDTVCIYMPMVPEAAIAMLACARVGAVHSVVFAGFSANSLSDRIIDGNSKIVLTSDGSYRGAKKIALKEIVDEALEKCPDVKTTIVLKRTGEQVAMKTGRDKWWQEELDKAGAQNQAETMGSEDELFILYTSGSTGKPKGVVHSCGGYMLYAHYSFLNVFQYNDKDIYWSTADVGWITGHSYIVYGPLLEGATTLMFEGIPTWPDAGRFWEVIDKYKVNIFYTAPTAIRSLMAMGDEWPAKYDMSSLRVLGSVGEPINEEAWHWFHEKIGKGKCPLVDTWWQTETGGILISPLANITPLVPSYATLPLPGVQPLLVDSNGQELLGNNVEGNLCLKFPWPSTIRTTYGDHKRCRQNYFATYPGYYFTGDGAKRDENGFYRILGRVDDVINVSGHRIGTAEVENAINQHIDVIESAVVGFPHAIKGQGIYAYVICDKVVSDPEKVRAGIVQEVNKIIGPIAKPDKIQLVSGLPKTRSGKIMRRILRKIAEGDTSNLGDISTLLDPAVVEEIKNGAL